MIENVKKTLRENGFEIWEDGDAIIIECSGSPAEFIRLVGLINYNIDEWTYEDMTVNKIEIDCSYETVKIFY